MNHASTWQAAYARLCEMLHNYDKVIVAFSGGTDSTLVLRAALEVLGAERVLAVLLVTPAMPARDITTAQDLAHQLGAPLQISIQPLPDDPRFLAGPPDRCYWCKRHLFGTLADLARHYGDAVILDGENVDDAGDFRPGHRAARELGVRSPLADCGLGKAEIRTISRGLGLPTWDTPSAACLVSRLPYGTPITAARLRMVGDAEDVLHELGFRQARVRHHGDVARLELLSEDLPRALEPAVRAQLHTRLHAIGFPYVALDLAGYRMGSMNEVLSPASDART